MRFVLVTVWIASVVVATAQAKNATTSEAPGEEAALYSCKKGVTAVAVTFKPETDVNELVAWAMGFSCKTVMIDPRIGLTTRKVTLVAPNKMTPAEAYRFFLGALKTIGLAVIADGDQLRVVDAKMVKGEHVPFARSLPDNGNEVIRYVVRPSYVAPGVLQQGFMALRSDAGDIQTAGALVLVVDYASHVRDMISFARLVDVPGGSDPIYTIPVKYADASKIAEKITALLGASPAIAPPAGSKPADPAQLTAPVPSKILVDERTNTLLVAGSEAAYNRVRALVDRVDIELGLDDGTSIHVYHLRAAVAEEMAKTLSDAIQRGMTTTVRPATPGGSQVVDRVSAAALEGQVKITPDKATNSLVILSSGRDFVALRDIVRELDVPRRQVYVEAMILEVSVQNDLGLGASAHGALPQKYGGLAIGGVQLPDLQSTNPASLASASGLLGGILSTTAITSVVGLGTTIPTYGILVQAFADEKTTKIVSNPTMIALDNEEAKYKIGINVPYQKGLPPTVSGSTVISSTPVDRMPLLLELNIKPHIASEDTVLLEVTHAAKDLVSKDVVLGPTWSERSLETRVVVKDQQTVAIGGLMQEHDDVEQEKVPILGDIPLLGHLFKYTKKYKLKTNLVILLTPYIIRDNSELEMIRTREVRQYDELVRSFHALDAMRYEPRIDYHRKRGLVEEINRAIVSVDEDRAERAKVDRQRRRVESGPVETAPAAQP